MTQQSHSVRSFDGAPPFNHPPLIRHLYENGLRIDRNILREILALPRETLLDDLVAMLNDAKSRYELFIEISDNSLGNDFHEDCLTFPLHAMFLLSEIDCSRSFDLALDFLKFENSDRTKNYNFTDFWFGDHRFETLWLIFFRSGQGREQELADFHFARNVDTYTKCPATDALQQMVFHCPERAQSVLKLFESIFERFLATESDDAVFDATLVAMVVTDYVATCPRPVSPLVRQLFENGLVDTGYCGSYSSLMESRRQVIEQDIRPLQDIFELYDDVVNTWGGYNPEEKKIGSTKPNFSTVSDLVASDPYEAAPKIGRNDPCPCGSGKKYKKCCLK